MRGISVESSERPRRALVSIDREPFGWRVASLAVSLVSAVLIASTLAYKFRGLELPAALLVSLLGAFVTVVLLLSRFLRLAHRQQAQTTGALDESERQFQSVFENALDSILILDDQARCRAANPASEQLFGTAGSDLLGQPIERFYKRPTQFRAVWENLLQRKLAHGEVELVGHAGSPITVEFTARAKCLPGQHVMILRDISQRLDAQRSLQESEERFQQMAGNIQEIFWMLDAKTRHAVYVNQAYETITGRSSESLKQNPTGYEEMIHPEDRVAILARLDEAMQSGQFNEQFRIVRPGGEVRWVWVRGFPVRDPAGTLRCLVGTALEITAQKEAEEKVATNLAIAQAAWAEAEALRKATLALTQELRLDPVMDTLLGSLAELVPYTCARVLVPDGGPHVLALGERQPLREAANHPTTHPLTLNANESPLLERVLRERRSFLLPDTKEEATWPSFAGHQGLRSWLCVPLIASQQYLGFLSVGHSEPRRFTEQHLRRAQLLAVPAAAALQNARLYQRAEVYGEELEKRMAELEQAETALAQSEGSRRVSEERFQKVFRSSPIAFSITSLEDGRFIDVNAAFEQRYGYTRAELIGRTAQEVALWENAADRKLMITQLTQSGPIRNIVTRLRAKSGEIKMTVYSADRIQLEGESCILAVSEDMLPLKPEQSN